jgi:invasion protein IalB
MVWRRVRMLRRSACGAGAAHKCVVAIGTLVFLAIAFEASAQTNPLPSIFLSPHKPLLWSWAKVCSDDIDTRERQRCFTAKDSYKRGVLTANVGILEVDGGLKRFFRLSMPDGTLLQHGVRLTIDWDKPVVPPFIGCVPPAKQSDHCAKHDYEVGPDLINRMKTGQVLTVGAIEKNGHRIKVQIDLKEFAQAYDGLPTALVDSGSQTPFRDDRVLQRVFEKTY